MPMRYTLLFLALLLAGCDRPTQPYTVKFIRPDGVVHKTHVVNSCGRPEVCYRNGSAYVYGLSSSLTAPAGWMIEVEDGDRTR